MADVTEARLQEFLTEAAEDDARIEVRGHEGACGAARGRSTVNVHPLPGRLRTRISPPFARTPFMLMESPSPSPVLSAPRCSKGRNRSSALPGGSPPHSSSTSIRCRLTLHAAPSRTS